MALLKCQTKTWGNSLGIVIPRQVVQRLHLKPHQEVTIEIQGKQGNVLQELFGSGKFKKSTAELLKEVRAELESRY